MVHSETISLFHVSADNKPKPLKNYTPKIHLSITKAFALDYSGLKVRINSGDMELKNTLSLPTNC